MAEEPQEYPYNLVQPDGQVIHRSRGFTGKGRVTYDNKEVYDGDFVDGVRIGKGTYSYRNGDLYSGGFDENKKHGLGKLTYTGKSAEADADESPEDIAKRRGMYRGDFADGKKHGEGSFRYANGDIYSGSWSKGKKHGNGTYVFKADGSRMTGIWENGDFSSGQWSLNSGATYQGTFKYNKPTGEGKWSLPNGSVIPGAYVQTIEPAEDEGAPPLSVKSVWLAGN